MGSVTRRYPNLNRGLVLLVTLLLPPATAAAVLHALSQERPALVAHRTIEARPAPEQTIEVAEEQTDDEAIEPTVAVAALLVPERAALPTAFANAPLSEAADSPLLTDALLSSLAPRAPPA
jgi:hypothetical protein